jgi:hypothetical protein
LDSCCISTGRVPENLVSDRSKLSGKVKKTKQ